MAYEIISQNNTTTTLSDGEHTIVVPGRVTLATSTSYTITDVNNNTATLEDGDGNVIRDVPCVAVLYGGGSGGDSHNLGWYENPTALNTAHPTAEAGDWAIVGSTDTVWVWDTDTSAWVDTDTKGQVTSVNNRTGAVTVSEVPDQTGYSGRVLGTDGFVAGWVKPEIVQVSALPVASEDEVDNIYQFVGATDATYTNGYFYKCVSDGQDPATYSWTRVDVQPTPPAGQIIQVSSLPTADATQLNKIYQYVGATDSTYTQGCFYICYSYNAGGGVTAYAWRGIPPVETLTMDSGKLKLGVGTQFSGNYPTSCVALGASANTQSYGVAVGASSYAKANGTAVGNSAKASGGSSIKIGYGTTTGEDSVAIGTASQGNNYQAIALGRTAEAAQIGSIQIGTGTNNTAGTLSIGLTVSKTPYVSNNYELLSADGTIPSGRLIHAINKYSSMPTAASTNEGWIVQFTGTTDATYTHGHLYECVSDGGNPATYSWTEVQLGGGSSLPSQTGNSGKFLTTNGTDASWSDKPLVNTATGTNSLTILGTAATQDRGTNIGVFSQAGNGGTACGVGAQATGQYSTAVGDASRASQANSIAIGRSSDATAQQAIGINGKATALCAIQIGGAGSGYSNSNANTFKVANINGNFEIMSADGTIPAARHASLPAADGTYVLKLVIASGVPTLSWVAE